jgi:hypothetical protein
VEPLQPQDDIPTLTQVVARPASGDGATRELREQLTQRVLERAWLLMDDHFSERLATQLGAGLDARLAAHLDEAIRAATPAIAAQVAGHLRATIEPLLGELVARALAEEIGAEELRQTTADEASAPHRQI